MGTGDVYHRTGSLRKSTRPTRARGIPYPLTPWGVRCSNGRMDRPGTAPDGPTDVEWHDLMTTWLPSRQHVAPNDPLVRAMEHRATQRPSIEAGAQAPDTQCLHQPGVMRNTCSMNRLTFSEGSKKKLWRPCREARALGL